MSREIAAAVARRQRAQAVSRLRRLVREPAVERCDLCGRDLAEDHRHMLNVAERRIVCACESCWSMRSGDPDLLPTGTRTLRLLDFALPDELWASLRIPIGLAFFMRSSATSSVTALYPSPAGATESELSLEAWAELEALNPILVTLERDAEGLIVNRLANPPAYAIAPIDRCYMLVGLIKMNWSGISGGDAVERAVSDFFEDLGG